MSTVKDRLMAAGVETLSPASTGSRLRSPSGAANLKSKISQLERSLAMQDEIIESQQRRISALEAEKERTNADLESHVVALQERFAKEIAALREDFEHRLSLQVAENRRLQSQISVQKSEFSALTRKLQETEQRVVALEAEIGEG